MPRFVRITLLIAAALVIIGFIYLRSKGANEGEPAPEIQAVLVNGQDFQLSSLKGDYVLLSFWGSWCGPCRAKSPALIDLHQKYKDKLRVVSVALEKNYDAGIQAAERDGFTWDYQIVEEARFIIMSGTAQDYGVAEIPSMFLISPEGVLLGRKSLKEIEEIIKA